MYLTTDGFKPLGNDDTFAVIISKYADNTAVPTQTRKRPIKSPTWQRGPFIEKCDSAFHVWDVVVAVGHNTKFHIFNFPF